VTSPAATQLKQLQRTLYEKAYQEAHAIVAGASRSILAYSAKFEKSLPKTFTQATQATLLEEMRHHRFLLYGDFHTLRQSQRGLLRLLRAYAERLRTNKIVIALEMFKARDQAFIDDYLTGRLTEEEFLESVSYRTEWGFPWPNFKMILDFAQARGIPVIGINTDNGGRDALAARDRFAAARLVDASERYPNHKIVCLIGEYHLADQHLPQALAREQARRKHRTGSLRVVNNIDRYYFQMPRDTPSPTEYLQLRKDFYCIMNTPPWMKWQSFSMWEEMRHAGLPQPSSIDGDLDSDFDLDLSSEDSFDVDYQFFQFVKNLSGFLEVKIDSSDLESFHIYFSPEGDFFPNLDDHEEVLPAEAARLVERATIDGVHFLPRSNTVLLTYVSINNLAEAAGQYLHTLLTGFNDTSGDHGEDFLRRILKSAIGMAASKILNPSRKCLELHHHRLALRRLKGRRLQGSAAEKRAAAAAVVKFDQWIQAKLTEGTRELPQPPRGLVIADRRTNYGISREIGQMLGNVLYKRIISDRVPATRLRRIFSRKVGTGNAVWAEVAALYRLLIPR
jgi:hypothetical protein